MRTNESVNKEMKTTRRKLFYKMYMLPWMILTVVFLICIGFLGIENFQLKKHNDILIKKIRTPERILVRMSDPINPIDPIDSEAEQSKVEKKGDGILEDNLVSEELENSESEQSKVEKRGFTDLSTFEEMAPELLELYILKREIDNEEIGTRNFRSIREDFSSIRTSGFTRENYVYAQELGVRVEVQLIKALEEILEKEFDTNSEIFITENKRDLFLRELKYEINEGVLNKFRVYWELNK